MINPAFAILVNHLWQSTLFVVAIWGLTLLLRRNSARVRYSLWLAASLKFLLPFALLAALGATIPLPAEVSARGTAAPQSLTLAGNFTAPLVGDLPYPQLARSDGSIDQPDNPSIPAIVAFFVWAAGAALVWARWLVRWLEIRRTLRRSAARTGLDFPVVVRSTPLQVEPGLVGIFRPVLLLPAGIEERLSGEQMHAVLAHERCHLRWRDNLTASLHMLVELLFWFFPPAWWIGARLIEERERACDEQVVRDGHAPGAYAEGILNVCEHYIAARLPSVSGISGADLRKRIESIVKRTLGAKLDGPRKLLLVATASCAMATPIAAGMLSGNPWQMLFSMGPATAGMIEYWGALNARTVGVTGITPGATAFTCPAPSPTLPDRQRALTALVAKLPDTHEKVLLYAVAANSRSDVQRLLAAGAPRNGDGFMGPESLMHIAAMLGDEKILELLVNSGFGINEQSYNGIGGMGQTPLMSAISHGRLENARWIVEHGADSSITDKHNRSALSTAVVDCRSRDLVPLLLKAGARPDFKTLRMADNLGLDLRTDPAMPGPPVQSWVQDPFLAEADAEYSVDYDGDDKPDHFSMFFSPNKNERGAAGFVKLSSRNPDQWIKAFATPPETRGFRIGIVTRGTHLTACSSKKPCKPGEATELVLKNPGISLSTEDGKIWTFYWTEADGRFLSVEDGPTFEHPVPRKNPWNRETFPPQR